MRFVDALCTTTDDIALWLDGKNPICRDLIRKILKAMEDEIKEMMGAYDWDSVQQIAYAAAELVKYVRLCAAAEKEEDKHEDV